MHRNKVKKAEKVFTSWYGETAGAGQCFGSSGEAALRFATEF